MYQSLSKPINQLLASLPSSEFQRLEPHLETVKLESGQVLHQPYEQIKDVYFPNRSMISIVSIMEDGSTTEIGMVGNEGMLGLPVILGGEFSSSTAIVQVPNGAMKLNAKILKKEFQRGEVLHKRLLLYTQAIFAQVSQNAACNRRHIIEKRLARWILSVQDCVLSNELALTQEFIAHMLGTRRSGVTVAANILQGEGIIRYNRGKITILDQSKLLSKSCECYELVRKEFIRLLGANNL